MELLVIIAVIVVVGYLAYKSFAPKVDTNKDGKIDAAEIKAAVAETICKPATVEPKAKPAAKAPAKKAKAPAAKKAKPAAKKAKAPAKK